MSDKAYYEYNSIADRKRVDFIADVLKSSLRPNAKVLDVGCGKGVIKDLESLSSSYNFKITRFGKSNFIEDVFPFSFCAKKNPFLQKVDCKIVDMLATSFTGGFFSVWEKNSY